MTEINTKTTTRKNPSITKVYLSPLKTSLPLSPGYVSLPKVAIIHLIRPRNHPQHNIVDLTHVCCIKHERKTVNKGHILGQNNLKFQLWRCFAQYFVENVLRITRTLLADTRQVSTLKNTV